jgi:hypothetical protein
MGAFEAVVNNLPLVEQRTLAESVGVMVSSRVGAESFCFFFFFERGKKQKLENSSLTSRLSLSLSPSTNLPDDLHDAPPFGHHPDLPGPAHARLPRAEVAGVLRTPVHR